MNVWIMLVLLLVFIAIRLPIALALAMSSAIYLLTNDISLVALAQHLSIGVNSFALLAAPFFLLTGSLMNTGGISEKLFGFVTAIIGHVRGALGHANILVSMIFAGISGTALSDAAGLGSIEIKAMEKAGYHTPFSVGVTASSATIGPIIPPSLIMVILGIASGASIGKLFLGGIIPGLLMGIGLMIVVAIISFKRKYPVGEKPTVRSVWKAFVAAIPSLITPVIIVGGILFGVVTPVEAGILAIAYSAFLSVIVYKEIPARNLPGIILDTMLTTAKILFIVSASSVFGWILSYEKTPQILAELAMRYISNPTVFLLIIMVVYLLLGCIMTASSIILLTVPFLLPTLKFLNIDLVHFGVLSAVCMSIGTITPPLGTVMFVLMEISHISIQDYIKGIWPFFGVLIFVMVLLVFVPQLTLWIPQNFGR
jgi:tripartite ATP-independent transporter DctM subunit